MIRTCGECEGCRKRLVFRILLAASISTLWVSRAEAVILPVHDYTCEMGEWRFGVTDWANDETILYFGPWQIDSPLSARGTLLATLGVLIAATMVTTARVRLRTKILSLIVMPLVSASCPSVCVGQGPAQDVADYRSMLSEASGPNARETKLLEQLVQLQPSADARRVFAARSIHVSEDAERLVGVLALVSLAVEKDQAAHNEELFQLTEKYAQLDSAAISRNACFFALDNWSAMPESVKEVVRQRSQADAVVYAAYVLCHASKEELLTAAHHHSELVRAAAARRMGRVISESGGAANGLLPLLAVLVCDFDQLVRSNALVASEIEERHVDYLALQAACGDDRALLPLEEILQGDSDEKDLRTYFDGKVPTGDWWFNSFRKQALCTPRITGFTPLVKYVQPIGTESVIGWKSATILVEADKDFGVGAMTRLLESPISDRLRQQLSLVIEQSTVAFGG